MEIYVGNLSYGTREDNLNELFASHGSVRQVKIITDRDSGRSRGFAFVSMDNDTEAQAAIDAVNGHELDGRALVVNQSRERKPREGGGGGNFNRGGGGGNRGGGGGGYNSNRGGGDRGGYNRGGRR